MIHPDSLPSKMQVAEFLLTSRERGDMPWPGYGPPERTRKLYGAEIIAIAQGESGKVLLNEWEMNGKGKYGNVNSLQLTRQSLRFFSGQVNGPTLAGSPAVPMKSLQSRQSLGPWFWQKSCRSLGFFFWRARACRR